MLVFLGGMNGFALTGDLFDMFVFFELMSVAAYALTGFLVEDEGALTGGMNFAVVNTLGSFAILLGIALIYAHTGALNLAQIGRTIAGHGTTGVVVVSFALIVVGMFTKAGVVPFHFWLSDAYAVVSPPVGVVFAGVLSELGLLGVARIHWSVFEGAFTGHAGSIGHVLMAFGIVTALLGGAMCFLQQHLRRMLAYSTIGHVGLLLIGLGLLGRTSTAGTVIYAVSTGLVKAALFLLVGILAFRLGQVDEEAMRGKGRRLVGTGVLLVVGALALAELPPFGTFVGKTLIEDAGAAGGFWWMPWVFGIVSALTAGAVLRAAGRIFLGWGGDEPDRFGSELAGEREARGDVRTPQDRTPVTMWLPAAILLAGGLAAGLIPGVAGHAERAAAQFQDRGAYTSAVLFGREPPAPAFQTEGPSAAGVWSGLASAAAAAGLAALALFRRRVVAAHVRRRFRALFRRPVTAVRRAHSGHVGDYAAWFALGLAALGGSLALVSR